MVQQQAAEQEGGREGGSGDLLPELVDFKHYKRAAKPPGAGGGHHAKRQQQRGAGGGGGGHHHHHHHQGGKEKHKEKQRQGAAAVPAAPLEVARKDLKEFVQVGGGLVKRGGVTRGVGAPEGLVKRVWVLLSTLCSGYVVDGGPAALLLCTRRW
jgi:hypothetical protein